MKINVICTVPTTSRTPPPSTTNATPTVLSQPHTNEDDGPEDSTPTERTACASPSPSVAYRRHSSDISPTQTLSCQSPIYVALPPVVPTSGDPMPAAKSPLYVALPPGVPISGDLASADKNSNTYSITKSDDDNCFFRSGQESIDTTRPLSIVSLNIKNVKSNTLCLTSLLEDYDFITLQEHWLFKFEQHMFLHLTSYPDVDYVARSCDETNPIPPAQPPRGYGGAAIIWRKSIGLKVIKVELGPDLPAI